MENLIKINPYQYVHVEDDKTNKRLVIGPKTFILEDHEKITSGKGP